MSLYLKTASELAEMIKNNEITSEEVTKQFLERIEKTEKKIGAFSNVFKEKVLEEARKYDLDNNENRNKYVLRVFNEISSYSRFYFIGKAKNLQLICIPLMLLFLT